LSSLENRILNLAGAAAISVAMNPMAWPQCPGKGIGMHAASAIIFFVRLAVVAVFLSKGRVKFIIYPPEKRRFIAAYNVVGCLMIAMPATVAALHVMGHGACESHWLFWAESFGVWAFSFFWFVKTLEYRLLLRIR
jgi:hypothetical protein